MNVRMAQNAEAIFLPRVAVWTSDHSRPPRDRTPYREAFAHQSRLPYVAIFSIFANSHSRLHKGQTLRVLSHREMQSRWKTCPQQPHAIE